MAWTTLPGGGLWSLYPNAPADVGAGGASTTLDASGEKVALLFQIPKSGDLETVEFGIGAFTQCTNGIKVSFQNESSSGLGPDGSIDQYRVVTVAGTGWHKPGRMTSDGTDNGTRRTVTAGQWVYVVFEFESFAASDALQLTINAAASFSTPQRPMMLLYTAAWVAKSGTLTWALKYSDGSYGYVGPITIPAVSSTEMAIKTSTTPDEAGLIFSFPIAVKVSGAWISGGSRADASDPSLVLYDTDGETALVTATSEGYQKSANYSRFMVVMFSGPVTLVAGSIYRLVVKPAGDANAGLVYWTFDSAALMDAMDGMGQDFHYTSRHDAGGWTEETTRKPLIGLLITGLYYPALSSVLALDTVNDVAGTIATRTLSAANETVAAGYYAATTLSAVDADLAAANIVSGKTVFGFAGEAVVGGGGGRPEIRGSNL